MIRTTALCIALATSALAEMPNKPQFAIDPPLTLSDPVTQHQVESPDLALTTAMLQLDLSQPNYAGIAATEDGVAIGYSHSFGRFDAGLILATDGHSTKAGIFAGVGW